jgi:two-component system sensor histidine kinase MtrB
MALQYSFINSMEPVAERYPDCLRPDWWPTGGHMAETATIWSESCGPYLLAYAFAQPGTSLAAAKPWLVIQALYLPDQDDPVPSLRTTLLLWSAVIVASAALFSLAPARSIVRPVARAGQMAAQVADGDLSVRIPVYGTDDIATMSASINTMADRLTDKITALEHANETGRRFVSDVAHELRTPSTALLASAEALRDPVTRNEAALLVAPQLRRLAALTEDLLEISRMDAGRAELVADRIDIVDLVAEVIADASTDIAYHGPTELTATTDPVRLQTILRNLLANAIQHGAPPITIRLGHQDHGVTIDVRDGGPGVPPDLRKRVFDRFVRGDESRHGTSSGLGLAIAAENARLLGGTLTVEPDGSTFRLMSPTDGLAPQPRLRDPLGATT